MKKMQLTFSTTTSINGYAHFYYYYLFILFIYFFACDLMRFKGVTKNEENALTFSTTTSINGYAPLVTPIGHPHIIKYPSKLNVSRQTVHLHSSLVLSRWSL